MASVIVKLNEHQYRTVEQIEKYQLLTEQTSKEREELQKQIKFHQVIPIQKIIENKQNFI